MSTIGILSNNKYNSITTNRKHNFTISSSSSLLLPIVTLCSIIIILNCNYLLFVNSYNLDYQKALIKQGPKGSYFGYSVAQHATVDTQPAQQQSQLQLLSQSQSQSNNNINSTFKSYVLVGAPKADSSRSATLAGVVKPGAIYKCDFSNSQLCQLLDIDSLAHSNQVNTYHLTTTNNNQDPTNNNNNQDAGSSMSAGKPGQLLASAMDPVVQRDNQWLGVSVKSQGINGYAVACAHRYVLKGYSYRWGQGICYSLTKNLTLHKTWQPCLNRPVNSAHEEYGYCQVGTSSDISDTSDIVIGSPGPYTWRGTVFTNSISFSPKDDRTWYMAPVQDDETKVDKYSYLGMSVISGKFFNKQQYFVSGAPRSKEVGQVLLMTKQQSLNGKRSGESTFRTDQIIDGEQIGSSFGYTLAKMDFNGDGQLDLIVSAPFYYKQDKEEGGAVYLYKNDNGIVLTPAGKLTGKPESRFGFALANCGDLNKDKYEDLAIGAPYDPQGGSVYIYLGSASGLKTTPAQIIKAASVSTNLQTFGYSLSGGLDMDLNGYPDLVVGSYADDSVFILRARPIIEILTKIEGNLTKIDPNKTTCDGEKNQLPCFKFNTCFELDPAAIGEYSDSMKLKYRIEAETFTGQKYSRVKFQDSNEINDSSSLNNNIIEKEILITDYYRGIKLKRCNTQKVYIKDKSDIQTPIQFKLSYSLVPPTSTSSSSLTSNRYSSLSTSNQLISSSSSSSSSDSNNLPPPFPILNQEEAQRIFSARFLKDCGSNDICESHLDVDGQIQAPKENLGINEPGYPSDKQINITIRAANNNEPAYEAKLFVTHPANLVYSGFKAQKQVNIIECSSIEKNLVKCDLGNPMPKGVTKLLMIFNTQNQHGQFDFNLMVNTTSQNSKDAKTSYDLGALIRKKVEIQIPIRQPPTYPEIQEPPIWQYFISILLLIILVCFLFYWLYTNGFCERRRAPQYTQANTDDNFN